MLPIVKHRRCTRRCAISRLHGSHSANDDRVRASVCENTFYTDIGPWMIGLGQTVPKSVPLTPLRERLDLGARLRFSLSDEY